MEIKELPEKMTISACDRIEKGVEKLRRSL
jgi:hypothetical protein